MNLRYFTRILQSQLAFAQRTAAVLPSFFSRAHAFGASTVILLCALTTVSSALDKKLAKATREVSDPKFDVCLPAIEALGHSKDGEAVSPLMKAFDTEKRPLVRRYLVDALGLLGSRLAQPTLAKALQDPDDQVRQSAVVALSSFADTASQQLIIDQAQKEQNFAVKANLVQALGRSKHPGASSRLQSFTQDQDPKLRKLAKDETDRRNKRNKK